MSFSYHTGHWFLNISLEFYESSNPSHCMRRGGAKKIGRGRVKLPVQFVTQKFSCIFTDDLFPLCSEQKVTLSMRGRRWLSLLKIAGLLLSSSFPLMASDVNDAHNLLRAFHSSYIVAQLLPKALQVSKKFGGGVGQNIAFCLYSKQELCW